MKIITTIYLIFILFYGFGQRKITGKIIVDTVNNSQTLILKVKIKKGDYFNLDFLTKTNYISDSTKMKYITQTDNVLNQYSDCNLFFNLDSVAYIYEYMTNNTVKYKYDSSILEALKIDDFYTPTIGFQSRILKFKIPLSIIDTFINSRIEPTLVLRIYYDNLNFKKELIITKKIKLKFKTTSNRC